MDFRMATVYLVLNWFFGILFLLLGLISISEKLVSLCFFAIALLLIPPVRKFVYLKTNKSLSRDARAITISVLIIIISFTSIIQNESERKAEQAQQAKQEAERLAKEKADVDYFNANKENIIKDIRSNNQKMEYQKSVALAYRYLASKNKELLSLYGVAKKEISKERINKIKININKTPRDDFSKLLGFYQELSVLDPSNLDHSKKVVFYEQKIADRERSERLLEDKAAEKVAFAQAQAKEEAEQEKILASEYEEKWGGINGNKKASISSMDIIYQRFYKRSSITQSVALIDIKIRNSGQRDIKDITFDCKYYGNSGTVFHNENAYLLEIIKAGQTLDYEGLVIGDFYQQTAQINCTIEDLKVVPN